MELIRGKQLFQHENHRDRGMASHADVSSAADWWDFHIISKLKYPFQFVSRIHRYIAQRDIFQSLEEKYRTHRPVL